MNVSMGVGANISFFFFRSLRHGWVRGFGRACKDARQEARRQKRKGGERGFKTRRYGIFSILIN